MYYFLSIDVRSCNLLICSSLSKTKPVMKDFIPLKMEFIYNESLFSILISNLYKNLQRWIWLKSCFESSFLSIIVMLLVERKFVNYFWVPVNVIAGLKFWFDLGEMKNSDLVGWLEGLGKLVFLIYFNSFISLQVFFKKFERLKFFGVLTVFLVNEVSVLSPDFNVYALKSSIEFELVRSPLVLCLSVLSGEKENRLSS